MFHNNGYLKKSAIVSGFIVLVAGVCSLVYFLMPNVGRIDFTLGNIGAAITDTSVPVPDQEIFKVRHVDTPDPLKGVYMTSWAAGHPKFRAHLFDLIENTEINSVVIDVKDYSGKISFYVNDPELKKFGADENRIPDVREFIGSLHDKGIYVIARISSFQDSFLIHDHPEWAVKTASGSVWKDYKGVKWLDPGAKPVWDYLARIGKEAYEAGFDELNFDYIRYPSDGNMLDISYDYSFGRKRTEVMKEFYEYLQNEFSPLGIPISADLFGLTTSAADDLGIGQLLSDAIIYFDYISPMVYPSHYAKGYNGYPKPAEYPYEVVKTSMDKAVIKAYMASSTPNKLRPWLQDFNLGAIYTPAMVRDQIQATYDSGLSSWMLWNAGSIYQKDALIPKSEM